MIRAKLTACRLVVDDTLFAVHDNDVKFEMLFAHGFARAQGVVELRFQAAIVPDMAF